MSRRERMGRHDSCSSFGHLERGLNATPPSPPSRLDGSSPAKEPSSMVMSPFAKNGEEMGKKRKVRDVAMTPVVSKDSVAVQTKRRQNKSLQGMQWFEYDADVVDNLSKTKRFASECMSDDVVSLMSINSSHQDGESSPSPLSKYHKRHDDRSIDTKYNADDDCMTPVKSRLGPRSTAGVAPISPSDTAPEDHLDLRRTALVRLALRNRGEHS